MRFHPPVFCMHLCLKALLTLCLNFSLLSWLVGHHHDHVHDSAVTSVSIVFEGVLDLDAVNCTWVSSLCWRTCLKYYEFLLFISSLLNRVCMDGLVGEAGRFIIFRPIYFYKFDVSRYNFDFNGVFCYLVLAQRHCFLPMLTSKIRGCALYAGRMPGKALGTWWEESQQTSVYWQKFGRSHIERSLQRLHTMNSLVMPLSWRLKLPNWSTTSHECWYMMLRVSLLMFASCSSEKPITVTIYKGCHIRITNILDRTSSFWDANAQVPFLAAKVYVYMSGLVPDLWIEKLLFVLFLIWNQSLFYVFFLFLFILGIMHILQIEIYVWLKLFWTKVTGSNPLLPNA